MYRLLQPLLFLLPAEKAHYVTLWLFKNALKVSVLHSFLPIFKNKKNSNSNTAPVELMGILFKNRVGLAAGFDKNAAYINEMAQLGFGFIEVGTVTPKPQKGNPKPRLFRLKKDQALINRMGFNNKGLEEVTSNLKRVINDVVIGGNLGKNKTTPNENATDDYIKGFEALYPYVDYFVVNVSSPNTPGLRSLQEKKPLQNILHKIQKLNGQKKYSKPVLLKIAPDLNEDQLNDIVEIVREENIPGIIATNTTISRENLNTNKSEIQKIGNGGLSGKPIFDRTNWVLTYLKKHLKNTVLIGVGGIATPANASQKFDIGADLVQIYSGMVYYGPHLIKDILESN